MGIKRQINISTLNVEDSVEKHYSFVDIQFGKFWGEGKIQGSFDAEKEHQGEKQKVFYKERRKILINKITQFADMLLSKTNGEIQHFHQDRFVVQRFKLNHSHWCLET